MIQTLWFNRLRIALVLLALVCLWQYVRNAALSVENGRNFDNLQLALQHSRQLQSDNGQLVQQVAVSEASTEQLRHASDSIFRVIDKENKSLKEVSRLAINRQDVRLNAPITAAYTGNPGRNYDSMACDSMRWMLEQCIPVPAEYSYETDSINIHGYVMEDGVLIDMLHLPNTMYQRDVVRRAGFLKMGSKRYTEVYNTNPLWRSDSMAVYQVRHKANAWHRWIKPALAAAATATITTYIISRNQ